MKYYCDCCSKVPLAFASDYEYGNYGDLLSRYIVESITGKKVRKWNPKEYKKKPYLCGIGSILNRETLSHSAVVWGSGFLSPSAYWKLPFVKIREYFRGNYGKPKILAVRGKYTKKILNENGIYCPDIFGDPALLMPSLYNPKFVKKHKLGVILHYRHEEIPGFLQGCGDFIKIPIMRNYYDITGFVDDVLSCEAILSSSLHGLIIANAYGVPCSRLKVINHTVHVNPCRDDLKYNDYISGLNSILPQNTSYDFNIVELSEREKMNSTLIDRVLNNSTKVQSVYSTRKLLDAFPHYLFD